MNRDLLYGNARSEHSRILGAYEEALKRNDLLAAETLLAEGEVVWQRACDLAPDEDSRTELNRAMNRILAFSIAIELNAAEEARRLFECMSPAQQRVINEYELANPGRMKIWTR